MLVLYGEGVKRAERGAELPHHSFALRQYESVLYFCWSGMSRIQWEAEHTNTPSSCTTPPQKDLPDLKGFK